MNPPVALDTNLLLLLVVGRASRSAIAEVKRLRAYSASDFDILTGQLGNSGGIVLTPNSVTETSNLLRSGPRSRHHQAIANSFKSLVALFGESYVARLQALERPECINLGVTDSVMLILASSGALLLTADLDLYLAASRKGLPAVNFNYLRT